jgi:hypothetical protein
MNRSSHNGVKRVLLAMAVVSAVVFSTATAQAWWGPVAPGAGGWDPQEAYLDEYGFLDPYGPMPGDFRRMHRDNWKAVMGYPVYHENVGPYGPRPSDVRKQHHRKMQRLWGYPYKDGAATCGSPFPLQGGQITNMKR